jgi:hypothetical protein
MQHKRKSQSAPASKVKTSITINAETLTMAEELRVAECRNSFSNVVDATIAQAHALKFPKEVAA